MGCLCICVLVSVSVYNVLYTKYLDMLGRVILHDEIWLIINNLEDLEFLGYISQNLNQRVGCDGHYFAVLIKLQNQRWQCATTFSVTPSNVTNLCVISFYPICGLSHFSSDITTLALPSAMTQPRVFVSENRDSVLPQCSLVIELLHWSQRNFFKRTNSGIKRPIFILWH